MIPLDSVLPELKRAVDNRVESSTLASLSPEELRHLIYKLVERQRAVELNATDHFRELVSAAAQQHSDLMHAKEHSVGVRTQILRELLAVVEPALPSLLGPVVIEVEYSSEGQRPRHHDHLRGCQLLHGKKVLEKGSAKAHISGTSWWIVALPAEQPDAVVRGRYAQIHHQGEIRSSHGIVAHRIELVTCEQAAEAIRDHQVSDILKTLHVWLVNLTRKGAVTTTGDLWRVADSLSSALEAMKGNPPR